MFIKMFYETQTHTRTHKPEKLNKNMNLFMKNIDYFLRKEKERKKESLERNEPSKEKRVKERKNGRKDRKKKWIKKRNEGKEGQKE